MKKMIGFSIFLCLLLIAVPLLALGGPPESRPEAETSSAPPENPSSAESREALSPSAPSSGSSSPPAEAENQRALTLSQTGKDEGFILYDKSSDQLLTVSAAEFLYGAVVCEMPLSFADEALKAQAVACHSYYARKRNSERANPKDELKGGDFEVNTEEWKIYTTKEEMGKKWGGRFTENHNRIKRLVDSVSQTLLLYDGEPILAAFHAQSGGKTENAFNVWGTEYPYLTAVDSPGDLLASGYRSETVLPAEGFRTILESKIKGITLDKNPKNWVGELTITPSGTVVMCSLGDRKASGMEMRNFFSLRSAVFDLSYNEKKNEFIFTVLGHGHGVGMSQYGAQEMARQGADYIEILSWYYPAANGEIFQDLK